MRKSGFTLAEILITLGIIGIVAALTAPSLINRAGGAKIGPTLAKIAAVLENANQQLLLDQGDGDLERIYGNDEAGYFNDLSKYINKSAYKDISVTNIYNYNNPNGNRYTWVDSEFIMPEGVTIYPLFNAQNNAHYGSLKGKFADLYVDIDGPQNGKNVLGEDIFGFILDKNGSVIPIGSQIYSKAYCDGTENYTWKDNSGVRGCNKNAVNGGLYCTGSIFENNLKIIYQ